MTTTAFIMAQGEQQRIGHLLVGPKQLIPIFGDQTIFERTVQQIRAAGIRRIVAVVHGGPWWVQVLDKVGVEMYTQPDPGASVVGGILQCEHLWSERNIIFLGDVVYSHSAVREMVSDLWPRSASLLYGRRGGNNFTGKKYPEIFGFSFLQESDPLVKLKHKLGATWTRHPDTKLWSVLSELPWVGVEPVFVPINDYTDDIDTEDDYVKRLPILRDRVIMDVS